MVKKLKLQTIIFDKKKFKNKNLVKSWIKKNNYKIDNRLKNPIMKWDNTFRVRQRNPDTFKKSTFKTKVLGKGIKGVFGYLKK